MAARFSRPDRAGFHGNIIKGLPYQGLVTMTKDGPRWTGEVRFVEDKLDDPLHWEKPRRIFVNSMSDLFHEKVPDEWIDRIFAVMALAPQHEFQCLTKRPERMQKYLYGNDGTRISGTAWEMLGRQPLHKYKHDILSRKFPLDNVWLGVSVEDQATADERIPLLLQTPAAVRWISAEPLLAPVNISNYLTYTSRERPTQTSTLDWAVIGGESGPGARPFDLAWARSVIDQCKAAWVPVFFKQGGTSNSCKHDHQGGHFDCFPEDLRVREYPK